MPTWFITWDGGCPGAIYIIWIPKEGSLRVISPCRHRKLPVLIFDWETIGKFPQIYICCWCNQRRNWLPLFLVIAFVRAENIKSRADTVSGECNDTGAELWGMSWKIGRVNLDNLVLQLLLLNRDFQEIQETEIWFSSTLGGSLVISEPIYSSSTCQPFTFYNCKWLSLVHLSTIYNIVNLYLEG